MYDQQNTDLAITKTYSLTFMHINRVLELAKLKNVSQAEIVREAIDLLYEKYLPTPPDA